MFQLALTGSIAMGKSEVSRMFRRYGIPVYDADAAVHEIYAKGGVGVAAVGALHPDAIVDGAVDRARLSKLVVGDTAAIKELEAAVHPLLGANRAAFLEEARRKKAPLVVLDVVMLFETGGEKRVDAVAVVSAPYEVQRHRVLARPGMSEEKFAGILARQTPDEEKRRRADYVIDTNTSLVVTEARVRDIIRDITGEEPKETASC